MVNPISMESVDAGGVWEWIKSNLLGMVLPAGLLGIGTSFVADRFGNSVPEGLRPFTNFMADLWNKGINLLRGFVAKEELAADEGMSAQVKRNAAFNEAAKEIAPNASETDRNAIADDLRSIFTKAIAHDTGLNMSVDVPYAVESAKTQRTETHKRILEKLRDQNKNWDDKAGSADSIRFDQVATRWADALSGVTADTDAGSINPNNPRSGYLGLLLSTQQGVAAEGKFDAGQVAALSIDVQTAAREAAHPEVAAVAPGAVAPTAPAAGGGRVVGAK